MDAECFHEHGILGMRVVPSSSTDIRVVNWLCSRSDGGERSVKRTSILLLRASTFLLSVAAILVDNQHLNEKTSSVWTSLVVLVHQRLTNFLAMGVTIGVPPMILRLLLIGVPFIGVGWVIAWVMVTPERCFRLVE